MTLINHCNLDHAAVLGTSFFDAITGVSKVSWSDPRAMVGWKHELPAWAWILLAMACLCLSGLTYHRLLGPKWARVGLASLRALTLLFILALLAGPMLVVANEQIDPDWLIVLVDRSASMRVHDMAPSGAAGSTDRSALVSRYAAVRQALVAHQNLFSDPKLSLNRKIVWMGFDSGTYDIDPPFSPASPVGDPEGQSTAIRTALEESLQRASGHPISGILLFTDGRSDQPTGSDLVHRLQQQAVSVFPVPLGDPHAGLDLSVGQVDYPDKAFINDTVPVNVTLERYPPDAAVDPSRVHVQLIDTVTNRVLDEQSPRDPSLRDPVHLSTQSDAAGPVRWRVKVSYDVPGSISPPTSQPSTVSSGSLSDAATDNTVRDVRLELVDRPIGVLYIEGYPRWEYRYLKNMLVREKSVSSSMMLISADRSFPQEGSNPITRLPRNAEELKPYDVIIIGDVPSNYFSTDQLAMYRDHVSHRGAGLLWIGGEAATPNSYDGTPLAALLPMRNPGAVVRADRSVGPVLMKPTPLADALGVLHLKTSGKSDEAAPGTGPRSGPASWPDRLSPLQWTQSLGELKPSAEALGVTADPPGKASPLLLRMRFGAGQTLYMATDETWRWRFGRGELYFERFWIQLVRMLARNRLQESGQRAVLSLSSRRVTVGEPAVVQLKVADQSLLDREMPKLSVGVFRVNALGVPEATAIDRLDLLKQSPEAGDTAGSTADAQYRALWRPSAPGKLLLRVTEPSLDDLGITRDAEAVLANDEIRNPAPDPDRLAALAKDTGGKVLKLDQLDQLPDLLPNRAKRTPSDLSEPLWNSYLALGLVMLMLTAEWIGRKMIRLV